VLNELASPVVESNSSSNEHVHCPPAASRANTSSPQVAAVCPENDATDRPDLSGAVAAVAGNASRNPMQPTADDERSTQTNT
jgi:hypothetical protein